MASLTSASHYVTSATRFQSRSSMYIDPRSVSTELVEAVPIDDMVNVSIDPAKSGLERGERISRTLRKKNVVYHYEKLRVCHFTLCSVF